MTKQELIDFENSVALLWRNGLIKTPVHFCGGNEDQLIEYFKRVGPDDWVFSTHRNAYHWLLKTGDTGYLIKQIMAGNSMHIIDLSRRFISSAIVGGNCGPAVGTAYAIKLARSGEHVHCFVGDGATDQGWFFEAMRYAVGQELPITFIIEDNNRSVETTVIQRWGVRASTFPDNTKVFRYSYKPTYPHCGDGALISW